MGNSKQTLIVQISVLGEFLKKDTNIQEMTRVKGLVQKKGKDIIKSRL